MNALCNSRLIFLFMSLLLPTNLFAENYLCISEQSTGFKYINNAWTSVNFKAGNKYMVDLSDRSVGIFGTRDRIHGKCDVIVNYLFDCTNDEDGRFQMHIENLRYQRTFNLGGFIFYDDWGSPFIEIGSCHKL